jgi:hypothetical protein
MASAVTGKLHRLAGIINRHVGNPTLRRMATEITGSPRRGLGGDDVANLSSLYHWVQNNIRYVEDPPKQDIFVSPQRVLATRQDDCDGMSVLIATFGKALGHNVILRAVGNVPGSFSHVYPLLDVPRGSRRGWLALDALPGRTLGQEPVGFHFEDRLV